MNFFEIFDFRIALIHWTGGAGEAVMGVRHDEFMAMADAFLGPRFDRVKLAKVEALQITLHETQSRLSRDLERQKIEPTRYLEEVNKVHVSIAAQCDAILGTSNFVKLFGVAPSEIGAYIEKEAFLTQA